MTAAELYEQSSDFRTYIAEWCRVKRAPFVLADWLRDHNMPAQARAAEWAAWAPDKRVWPERGVRGGVYPSYFAQDPGWFWVIDYMTNDSDGIPEPVLVAAADWAHPYKSGGRWYYYKAEDAILALLDGWAKAEADGVSLPVATVGVIGLPTTEGL